MPAIDFVLVFAEAFGDLLYLLIGILLIWRMYHGVTELYGYNEQTMVLRLPVWPSAALMVPAFLLLIVTTFYTMIGHLKAARA